MTIFEQDEDYAGFEAVLEEAVVRFAMRLRANRLAPDHWRLVLRPREDGDFSRFTGWLTLTHTPSGGTACGGGGTATRSRRRCCRRGRFAAASTASPG